MKLNFLTACALACGSVLTAGAQQVDISPVPQNIQWGSKAFNSGEATYYLTGTPDADAARVLTEALGLTAAEGGNVQIVAGKRGDAAVAPYASLIPQQAEGYYLSVEPGKVVIAGADDAGTFYGAKTFAQIASQPEVMGVTVTDWPLTAVRGVIEGFYGNPWSFQDRVRQFDFYGDNKMNIYIYGPKDDPYHHSRWYEPYPEAEAQQMTQLVKHATDNKVKFVWAMHPSNSISSDSDKAKALTKFAQMYDLGVRAFAIFFDDISANSVNDQVAYLNFLTTEFVNKHTDVEPMIVCPTQYNKSWSSGNYLSTMGNGLDAGIRIMWTGNSVVDMIDKADCAWFKGQTGRDPFIWLNYPVNDYGQHNLLMGPVWGNEADIYDKVSAFCSNPMQYAEASKVALYSLADYAWNPTAYDSDAAWQRGFHYLTPGHEDAYRTFCINNVDLAPNTHGLRRMNESPEFKALLDKYPTLSADAATDFSAYFAAMKAAADDMLANTDQPELVAEILEFLQYFDLQAQRGRLAMALYTDLASNSPADFIEHYRSYADLTDRAGALVSRGFAGSIQSVHPRTGTLYVEPFIKNTVGNLVAEFKESGADYPSDLFPAQVIENGTYYIKVNGKYLTNRSGSSYPTFQAEIDDVNPGRQQWIISIDPATNRYKIINEWDKRYINELGQFTANASTNPYEAAWHTYDITRFEGKCAIQNGGSAGSNFWTAGDTRINKGSANAYSTDNFIFEIVPVNAETSMAYPMILGKDVYILDEQGRALTYEKKGSAAVFKSVAANNADKRQLYRLSAVSATGRVKIVSKVGSAYYLNENAVFGTNPYSDDWNTYCFTERAGKFAIQNAGSSGTAFWVVDGDGVSKKSVDHAEAYQFTIITPADLSSISEVTESHPADAPRAIYNLQGMKVNHPTEHGIYIVNGRKTILP